MAIFLCNFFFISEGSKAPFLRIVCWSYPKNASDVRHSLKIFHRLDFEIGKSDDFWNFKTTFCRNFDSKRNGNQKRVQKSL